MPTPPYAKVLVAVNGGATTSGGIDVPSAAAIVLSGENVGFWSQQRWEIYDYPEGWATPAGWTLDGVTGIIYSTAVTPPSFTLPTAETLWSVWMIRLKINAQVSDDQNKLQDLIDERTCLSMLSPNGVRGIGALEENQFTSAVTAIKKWLRSLMRALVTIDQKLTRAMALTANFTTTLATAQSTPFTLNVKSGEVWEIEFNGTVQCNNTGGVRYDVNAPGASTIEGWLLSSAGAITTLSYQRVTAIATLTTATHTVANTPGPDRILARIVAGADGAITLRACSQTAAQTTTIFAGATFKARRLTGV